MRGAGGMVSRRDSASRGSDPPVRRFCRIGRRNFLKNVATGAALGPAFIPGRALGRDGVVAPSDRITVACIGTGWQGGNNVDSFLEEPGAQVVAACDIDAGHLENARQAINKKYGNQDCKTYHEF